MTATACTAHTCLFNRTCRRWHSIQGNAVILAIIRSFLQGERTGRDVVAPADVEGYLRARRDVLHRLYRARGLVDGHGVHAVLLEYPPPDHITAKTSHRTEE